MKDHPGGTVGHRIRSPGGAIKEILLPGVSLLQPFPQSRNSILAEVDYSTQTVFLTFVNLYIPFLNVDIHYLRVEQFAYPHSRSQKNKNHGPVSRIFNDGKELPQIFRLDCFRQPIRYSQSYPPAAFI